MTTDRKTYWTAGINDPAPHHFKFANGQELHFQDGPIALVGVNGLQAADLLEALVLRAENFYSRFGGEENRLVLGHLRAAFDADEARTKRRLAAGTEGVSKGA